MQIDKLKSFFTNMVGRRRMSTKSNISSVEVLKQLEKTY